MLQFSLGQRRHPQLSKVSLLAQLTIHGHKGVVWYSLIPRPNPPKKELTFLLRWVGPGNKARSDEASSMEFDHGIHCYCKYSYPHVLQIPFACSTRAAMVVTWHVRNWNKL